MTAEEISQNSEEKFFHCSLYGFGIEKNDENFVMTISVFKEDGTFHSDTILDENLANILEKLKKAYPDLDFIENFEVKTFNLVEDDEERYRLALTVDVNKFRNFKKGLFFSNGVEINNVDFFTKKCYSADYTFNKYIFHSGSGSHTITYVFPLPEISENNAPSGSASTSANVSAETIKQALKEVLEEENSDLIRVVKDCPYIPIRSLDGRDGAVYKDGEFIYLDKIGKTFKVLGSFHIVKDTDLNLATCYALGIDSKEPSLILPELILNQLKGGG